MELAGSYDLENQGDGGRHRDINISRPETMIALYPQARNPPGIP